MGNRKKPDQRERHARPWAVVVMLLFSAAVGIAGSALTYLYISQHGKTAVYIQTNGPKEVTVDYGTAYQDPGAVAFAVNELGKAETLTTVTNGTVDVSRLGNYQLTYSAVYEGTQYTDTRTVAVVDREKPVMKASVDENRNADWRTGPKDFIITAADNYDGDISDRVTRSEQDGKIVYTAEDSSGNRTTLLLRAPEKIDPPEIEFDDGPGDSVIYTYLNEEPEMPKAFAIDGDDNELTEWIQIEGSYDISTPGTYRLRYFLTNYLGETVEAYRTVVVEQLINPNYILNPDKVIRLTFEDGPCANTAEILSLLDKYNVKSTFFVSCWNTPYLQLIQSEKQAGHAVGIYSFDSDPKQSYGDAEFFRIQTENAQDVIRDYTGSKATLLRFPGGSQTGINATEVVMGILRLEVGNWGLKYYDWTIDPADTANSTAAVRQAVINGIAPERNNIVRLHDSSSSTLAALEDIIIWGLKNGYTFIPLS